MNSKDKQFLSSKFPDFVPIVETDATTTINKIYYSGSIFVSATDFTFICKKFDLAYKIPWSDIKLFKTKTGIFSNKIWIEFGDNHSFIFSSTSSDSVNSIDVLSKTIHQLKSKPNEVDAKKFIEENKSLKSKISKYENLLLEKEQIIYDLKNPINEEAIHNNDLNDNIITDIANDSDSYIESFTVVGLNYEGRREKLKKMINSMKKNDEFIFLYDDLKGRELKEQLEFENRIFEIADYESIPGVFLEKEPGNEYDVNAIKVMVSNDYGNFQIGYVPREIASNLSSYVDNITSCTAYVYGGKYKEMDYFEYKIKIGEKPYGLRLDLFYHH
ncbi:HIRAN domain-containing protein [Staphylococcus gallinarum]|uniref:HIRAN domain-containing protein n=1 Tax=Staphylococcus gallinarum TaxID=1293 RepID=UPI0031723BE5